MNDIEFRQSPAFASLLEYRYGNSSWAPVFADIFVTSNNPTPSSTTFIQYIKTNNTTYLKKRQTYGNNIGNFAPNLVYDGSEKDNTRNIALRIGLGVFVDQMCTFTALLVNQLSNKFVIQSAFFENTTSFSNKVLGVESGQNIVFGSTIAGAIIKFLTVNGLQQSGSITDTAAKNQIKDCLYAGLNGVTVTQSRFQAALDSCSFAQNSYSAELKTLIQVALVDLDVYLQVLEFINALYGAVNAGFGSRALSINFRNPAETFTDFVGTNLKKYLITLNGSTKIAQATSGSGSAGWRADFDFTASNGGWSMATPSIPDAIYTAGVGWTQTNYISAGINYVGCQISIPNATNFTTTSATVTYDLAVGSSNYSFQLTYFNLSSDVYVEYPNTSGTNKVQSASIAQTGNLFYIGIRSSVRNDGTFGGGTVTIKGVTIEGTGTPPSWATPKWSNTFNFLANNGGWAVEPLATGKYTAGQGWQDLWGYIAESQSRGVEITLNFSSTTVTRISLAYSFLGGAETLPSLGVVLFSGTIADSNRVALTTVNYDPTNTADTTIEWLGSSTMTGITLASRCGYRLSPDPGGNTTLKSVTIEGTGTPPPWANTGVDTYGDAFYKWQGVGTPSLYGAGLGLQIDGATPSTIPSYNPNHTYSLDYTGDGSSISFKYADGNYADNSNNLLYIQICAKDGSGVP